MPTDTPLKCPFAPHMATCVEEQCRLWMARRNKCAVECLALDVREALRQIRDTQGGDE